MIHGSTVQVNTQTSCLDPWFECRRGDVDSEEWQFSRALRSVLAQPRADASVPNRLVRAALRVALRGGMMPTKFESLVSADGGGFNGSLWHRYMHDGAQMSVSNLRSLLVDFESNGWLSSVRPKPSLPHPSTYPGWSAPAANKDAWWAFERPTFLDLLRLRLDGIEAAAWALQKCRAAGREDPPSYDEMLDAWTEVLVQRKARPKDVRSFGQQKRAARKWAAELDAEPLWYVRFLPPPLPKSGTNLAQ
jgi:hypothetical protein